MVIALSIKNPCCESLDLVLILVKQLSRLGNINLTNLLVDKTLAAEFENGPVLIDDVLVDDVEENLICLLNRM